MEAAACGHAFWREGFHGDKSDITGVFDVFLVRALAVVARVARGGKARASPGRCHATKCLLRRQTESQRDFVHHRRRPGILGALAASVMNRREGTLAGGKVRGRRCAGGRMGPARALIFWS